MLNKPVKTLMYKTPEEYDHYAKAAIPQGAKEIRRDGMKYLLVNFKSYVFKAVYPGYVEPASY